MTDMRASGFEQARELAADEGPGVGTQPVENSREPIGMGLEIGGSGSQIALDLQRLGECAQDTDPSVALAGRVGSQVKIRVGNNWLLASVRQQKQDHSPDPADLRGSAPLRAQREERRQLIGRQDPFAHRQGRP